MANKLRGIALVEFVVYASLLIVLTVSIVTALITLSTTFRTIKSVANIESATGVALERMAREIRDASSVDTAQSTLGSSPGVLFLNTTDNDGNPTTVQFFTSGQSIRIKENGIDSGPLTDSSVRVTRLIFRHITTAQSHAVKIEMTVESGKDKSYRSKAFYTTVVMRGSYPTQ
jgi:Tfp pilus assembly protein PilW